MAGNVHSTKHGDNLGEIQASDEGLSCVDSCGSFAANVPEAIRKRMFCGDSCGTETDYASNSAFEVCEMYCNGVNGIDYKLDGEGCTEPFWLPSITNSEEWPRMCVAQNMHDTREYYEQYNYFCPSFCSYSFQYTDYSEAEKKTRFCGTSCGFGTAYASFTFDEVCWLYCNGERDTDYKVGDDCLDVPTSPVY